MKYTGLFFKHKLHFYPLNNVNFIGFTDLEESRDELQAAAALQAGRELLMLNPCNNNAEKGSSLAVELLAGMNPDQVFFFSNISIGELIKRININNDFLCVTDRRPRRVQRTVHDG